MILNSTEWLFFFLGMLTTVGMGGMVHIKLKYAATGRSLALAGTALFLLIFTLAWFGSSIIENEHQAANMGLLFFGLPGILCLALALKQLRRSAAPGK